MGFWVFFRSITKFSNPFSAGVVPIFHDLISCKVGLVHNITKFSNPFSAGVVPIFRDLISCEVGLVHNKAPTPMPGRVLWCFVSSCGKRYPVHGFGLALLRHLP